MIEPVTLYRYAKKKNIAVESFKLAENESISFMSNTGNCYIGIDPMKLASEADELCKLAHEIGHCETGAFYNRYSSLDIREKHETRAWRWAIQNILPERKIKKAYRQGFTEPWELAEYFGVPEFFIRMAIDFYQECRLAKT